MDNEDVEKLPGSSFFQIITPSNIAHVILLIKNGQEMWDQEIGVAGNREKGDDKPKKKVRPLSTSGMGKKHSFSMSLWNKVGLEYYYTAEENWKVDYNLKEMFLKLCTNWERWEPKDKGNGKQALKMWWKKEDVVTKLKNDKNDNDKTWYGKGGYTADLGVTGTWEHDKDIGDKSDDDDDNKEEEGAGEVETGREDGGGNGGGGDEDSSADVISEQRKSNRQKGKKTK